MGLDTLRTLYAHHWWANRTLLDVAATLGEDVAAREIGKQFSEPTLKRMFLHIYGVDLLWLSRWRGISPVGSAVDLDILDEAKVAPTLAALGERWLALERDQASYLDELREHDLERAVQFRLLSGKEYTQPLGFLLHHVTDHGTHHRSEIATMLTMVSGSPPGTGLARFIFFRSGQDRA
jgi:uncharacterized damage-inducible protein DinB